MLFEDKVVRDMAKVMVQAETTPPGSLRERLFRQMVMLQAIQEMLPEADPVDSLVTLADEFRKRFPH